MNPYFDNAATTPMAPEVLDAMLPYLKTQFGNPSSTHAFGRAAKTAVEQSRKTLAELLHCEPGELVFTGSGTESDNAAIFGAIRKYKLKKIVCNPLEHHAVIHAVEITQQTGVEVEWLRVNDKGEIDLAQLKKAATPETLVIVMYANNELGLLSPVEDIAKICEESGALWLSDLVQGIGHYRLSLSELGISYGAASAHKFHGPKGIGLLFQQHSRKLDPFLFGGGQERGIRSGTEHVAGIVGMAKALDLFYTDLDNERRHITNLKTHLIQQLESQLPQVGVFDAGGDKQLYSLVSLILPPADHNQLLLFNLDLKGIAVSGGSACASGALQGSHVLQAIGADERQGTVRVSFNRYNTLEEVDYFVKQLNHFLA